MKNLKNNNLSVEKQQKTYKRYFRIATTFAVILCMSIPTYATNDPLTVVNNLSEFIFGLIRAIDMILLGFGIMQVGLSLKSHDPSQRANGFLTVAGGIIITFTKEILVIITGLYSDTSKGDDFSVRNLDSSKSAKCS